MSADNSYDIAGSATTAPNNGNNNMIAASFAGMQHVRDEEKAALLELLDRQQANQMNFNALSNNMGGGGGGLPPQNSSAPTENNNMTSTDFAAANHSAAAYQLNNNMGMNPMMLNPMMNSAMMNNHMMGMGMGMNMNSMNNNFMNFEGMNPQQAVLSNSGGFNLPMVQSSQEDPGWEEQFFALKAYQRETGHCKVPARFKSNPKLGRWVMTQRRQFTLLMQGYPSALTAERIQRLESIAFTWSIRPEPVKTWNRKFQELKVYKNTFGNCMVPQRYQANPQLGTWVHTQRRQYKLMIEGKKSSMTREKAQALDSIGFFWAAKPSSASRSNNNAHHTQHARIGQEMNNSIGLVEDR
mmetsp:Transcript_23095/g.35678  ORF Transcript_23095/g.35678 Transcript_23095/m.35678 type:complete len:354 (+) Transcript_23095:65-1126(+)